MDELTEQAFELVPVAAVVVERESTRIMRCNEAAHRLGLAVGDSLSARACEGQRRLLYELPADGKVRVKLRLGQTELSTQVISEADDTIWVELCVRQLKHEGVAKLAVVSLLPAGMDQERLALRVTTPDIYSEVAQFVSRGLRNTIQAVRLDAERTGALAQGADPLRMRLGGALEAGAVALSQWSNFGVFGRSDALQRRTTRIHELLTELEVVARETLGSATYVQELEPSTSSIWGDRSALVRLLYGFFLFSRFRVLRHPGVAAAVCLRAWEDDAYVHVCITDDAGPWSTKDESMPDNSDGTRLRAQERPEGLLSELREIAQALGAQLSLNPSPAGVSLSVMLPVLKMSPRPPSGSYPTLGGIRQIFVSSQNAGLFSIFSVASERIGAIATEQLDDTIVREGIPPGCRAWIMDLDWSGIARLSGWMRQVCARPRESLPVPLLFVSRHRRVLDRGLQECIDQLCRRGATFLRGPITAQRAAEFVESLAGREADAPWLRVRPLS